MSVLNNFDDWKSFLGNRLEAAQNRGISDDTISDIATQLGGFLAQSVDPKNEEQRLLSNMWQVASKEEQQSIANMMIKLVQNEQ